jgi:hypothetical protein
VILGTGSISTQSDSDDETFWQYSPHPVTLNIWSQLSHFSNHVLPEGMMDELNDKYKNLYAIMQ